jgi:hypothetical protein
MTYAVDREQFVTLAAESNLMTFALPVNARDAFINPGL